MKAINCFILSIFFLIAGCGNIKWFPGGSTGPALTLAFSVSTAQIGNPVTLTFTITNVADNPAQSNLTFSDTLGNFTNGHGTFPVFVAIPPNYHHHLRRRHLFGKFYYHDGFPRGPIVYLQWRILNARSTSCTVSIDITSNASTDATPLYTNGPGNVTSNLDQSNLLAQSLAFTPFTSGTLSATDLVVNTTNTQISLYVSNSGNAAVPATVTVEGFDTSSALQYTATINNNNNNSVSQGGNFQPFSQTVSGVPAAVIAWKITALN